MPARSSSRASSVGDGVRHDKLLSKMLVRVVSELKNKGVEPTATMMDQARLLMETQWSNSGMTDRQIRGIATEVSRMKKNGGGGAAPRSMSAMDSAPPLHPNGGGHQFTPGGTPPAEAQSLYERAMTPPPPVMTTHHHKAEASPTPSAAGSQQASELRQLLRNTTRRERENLANAEWIAAMEKDRIAGIEGKKNDRMMVQKTMFSQRKTLDSQIDEHNIEAALARKRAKQAQDDMTSHIENHRYLTKQEKQAASDKAMKEKAFRAAQQIERDRQREEARTKEHNDQVRHCMMVREELEQERQEAIRKKAEERRTWERVMNDNQARLEYKAQAKGREREEDRMFQKNYADQLDRVEKERADAAARKAARAQYFQKLADGVASTFMAKEQDLTDKIEAEYNAQLEAALKDERNRKTRLQARTEDCQATIRRQMVEHDAAKKAEREAARREADLLAEQIAEAKHQEQCRKIAAKQEAARLKKYLGSQLQMAHFKEARPLETGIARPPSRAQNMYSPSKYTPSLKPESLVGAE